MVKDNFQQRTLDGRLVPRQGETPNQRKRRMLRSRLDAAKRKRTRLEDKVNGVDGSLLVRQGKGIELFQKRVMRGFYRGLGNETVDALRAYTSAVQASSESIGAYFKRRGRLYDMVQRLDGCAIGLNARKVFVLCAIYCKI